MNPCQSQLSACHHLASWPWDVVYRAITALLLKLVLKLSISRTFSTDAERCAVQLDTFICGDQIVGVLSTDKTRLSSFLHPFIFWHSNKYSLLHHILPARANVALWLFFVASFIILLVWHLKLFRMMQCNNKLLYVCISVVTFIDTLALFPAARLINYYNLCAMHVK